MATYSSQLATITSEADYGPFIHNVLHGIIDPNHTDCYGWTPLHVACRFAKPVDIRSLLEVHHVDINYRNHQSETPIYILLSCREMDEELLTSVHVLLEHNAKINYHNKYGVTYLFYVIKWGRGTKKLDVIRCMLHVSNMNDINIQLIQNYDNHMIGDTILHCAVQKNDLPLVQIILEYCDNNNCSHLLWIRNSKNETPYDLAKRFRYTNMIECLKISYILYPCHMFLRQQWIHMKKNHSNINGITTNL